MQPDPITQTSTPPTPAAGQSTFYVDTSGVPHLVDSSAVTHAFGTVGTYDVTNYGVLGANTGAQNVSALNALLTLAPGGSVIYFPSGIYAFNAGITAPAKTFTFQGNGGVGLSGSNSVLQLGTATTGFLTLPDGQWGTNFRDLVFAASTTQTSGAMITVPGPTTGNCYINLYRCTFASNGGSLFDCIAYSGVGTSGSANQSTIDTCNFTGFSHAAVNVDSNGSSLVIVNSTANGTTFTATACVILTRSGACQVDNCDFIGAVNNLLINPASTQVNASTYVTNTYFDNSTGSCVKITGAGATVRARFVGCSMTLASTATNFSAVEISSSGTTLTTMASGIDFSDCSILNTFGTALTGTAGFNVTGASDFTIDNCRIQGWVTGVSVTPAGGAGFCRPQITNCLIGGAVAGLTGVIGTGILLNAGSFTYGSVVIVGNNVMGATTAALTDNSTIPAAPTQVQKVITNNIGLAANTSAVVGNAATVTTTVETIVLQLPIPSGSLRVGSTFKLTLNYHPAATSIITVRVRVGSAGTTSDAALISGAQATGTLTQYVTGMSTVQVTGASATHLGNLMMFGGAAATTVLATNNTATSGTFNSVNANYVSVTVQNTSSTTTTVYGGTLEIVY